MKIRISRLDFRKDVDFDTNGAIEDKFVTPCVVQYKKHWWSMWRYIMDNTNCCPRLFFSRDEIEDFVSKIDPNRVAL